MEEYITIHKIVSLIKQYQQSQVGIGLNSFGFGNIVEFGNTDNTGMTPTYPFVFVTPQNISYEENIVTYNMSLIFADRINDDLSNEVDVISDMDIQARRFMSFIKRGMNQTPDLYNKMDIILPTNAVPFQERFNDFVGGVALDCSFVVFTDINACDYYEPEPEPSPSPTNTATPTTTPTQTPTQGVSPTPTETPTNTPTTTATPTTTTTPTPTDPRDCRTYTIAGGGFGTTFNWTNCDGTAGTTFIYNIPTNICAKQGSVSQTGFPTPGTITDIGTCPLPSPTPTATETPTTTPTNTPSVSPTNTATPTITPTNTTTPTNTPPAWKYYSIDRYLGNNCFATPTTHLRQSRFQWTSGRWYCGTTAGFAAGSLIFVTQVGTPSPPDTYVEIGAPGTLYFNCASAAAAGCP